VLTNGQRGTDNSIVLDFRGPLRDTAVAELGKCIATLEDPWSLGKER